MAKSDAVWGIDIGQCALKALRCRPHEQPDKITADAFDYIEYPQILTQPGADPVALVTEAMKTFLARNNVRGDRLAISVPGQSGLARFIKLPPVEAKKIPDIVRYEARQQIPFDLNDVIWDYQRLGVGSESEGFALETEVGLFAMKREQVEKALEPFVKAGLDVDIVQLTPLALYNFVRFDQMTELPPPEAYDPDDPPPSVVIFSLGTDASDLVVTNGYRVWQRSIPMGGNHFTRALTKELKLTFPKAEHLKRNATAAQDPKAVFQAMRPVFNDLLTEVQRSIGYFSSIDRNAKISNLLAVGNAIKLPGLRKYLEQNLGIEVRRVEAFRGLVGGAVVAAPAFQENLGCFGVCYGLALQGLGRANLQTNLVPRGSVIDRVVREKKPWAVAMAAVLMLGCTISFSSFWRSATSVDESAFKSAEAEISRVNQSSSTFKSEETTALGDLDKVRQTGQNLVGNIEGRIVYLELLKALNDCLPREAKPTAKPGQTPQDREIELRNELHVSGIDFIRVDRLEDWFATVQQWYVPGPGEKPLPKPAVADAADPGAASPAGGDPAAGGEAPKVGPSGPGWVIALTGRHYHNSDRAGKDLGAQYVRDTFLRALQTKKIKLPAGVGSSKEETLTLKQLGLSYPVLVSPGPIEDMVVENPNVEVAGDVRSAEGVVTTDRRRPQVRLRQFKFNIQMAWQPAPPSKRHAPPEGAAGENQVTSNP